MNTQYWYTTVTRTDERTYARAHDDRGLELKRNYAMEMEISGKREKDKKYVLRYNLIFVLLLRRTSRQVPTTMKYEWWWPTDGRSVRDLCSTCRRVGTGVGKSRSGATVTRRNVNVLLSPSCHDGGRWCVYCPQTSILTR